MYAILEMLIDGKFTRGSSGKGEPVINPATEQTLAELPHAAQSDLEAAVAAAEKGFNAWKAMSAYDRYRILRKGADILRSRADAIATILTLEQGKIIAEAKIEVVTSADILDWYAEEGRRAYGRIIPGRMPGVRQMVIKEPVGIVAAFTPWNFPALTPMRKIAGALAAGCSIILKPSEETPGTAVEVARCLQEAGLPEGVLNVVFGVPAEISSYLIAHPKVRKISFTGSTAVGKQLMKLAAEGMKRTTMELGGHAPVIVFDDVDIASVAKIAAGGKYRNAGQVCISPTRFFVHETKYKQFVDAFTEIAAGLKLGDGLDPSSQMGPMANARRLEAMDMFVSDAKAKGAVIKTGGERPANQGFFYKPTVLADVPAEARIMTEEPFGPLAPIVPFKSFDEVVERANGVAYGLAAYAFTNDEKRATAIADALQWGMVGVNSLAVSTPETPFGGIKDSGHGSEGGIEGLEAYLNIKFVSQA
ncbi:NAD-dependent succinate-semialdehyde dehydrogenase [Elioraea sp. Yellowstone]|uniref:NAD-dependent succinate-semialdehyde dehydrogenase n=1 Tax=Elioraea sp. Yellowstone TaxID=2592070 RepID=UPI0011501308|nr:NAD-dependent succinate-semialdehyde dehydrogenase [Elioraea sp. Yellowstone]TQF77678.1 NAD-dependent succinate-semialdehyde dehydrogenase [Elioraea sp. Yellowstone]